MATTKFFGRYYKLTITKPEGPSLEFEVEDGKPAMDIKFDVKYARGQTAREGTVSILGLSVDTMNSILMLAGMTRGKAMSQLIRVRLEVGYFTSAGTVEVINGFAWYATITSPPQMWLNIRISEVNPLGARTVTFGNVSGKSIRQVVETVLARFVKEEGMEFRLEDATEDQIIDEEKDRSVQFTDAVSLSGALSVLNEKLDDKVWFLLKTRDNEKIRTVLALDKDADKVTPADDVQIDGDNGLLSVTGIDAINGCITTFIDGTVAEELTHLVLRSALNPQANGRYYIVRKEFVGHFMGQEWYTRYFCSAREGDAEAEAENRSIPA